MKKQLYLLLCAMLMFSLTACQKGFLDEKPDKAQLIPETLTDMQNILDNTAVFNRAPTLTGLADGDYYTTDAGWKAYSSDSERQTYTWAADIFGTLTITDWNVPYQQVFYANVVLEGLEKLPPSKEADVLRGTALFYRAFAFYNLAQMFTLPYQASSANTDLGIPLRLHADVTEKVQRSTLQATYDRILTDVKQARQLVPATVFYKTRPNTAAAFGLLSRVCLALRDYPQAGKYADSCLQLTNLLIDYNTLSTTATRPFTKALPNGNDEMVYYEIGNAFSYTTSTSPTYVDNALYASYAANDLRKPVFFKAAAASGTFKGTYSGVIQIFFGIATDEMYFNRAEASARQGSSTNALADLNKVLAKRWKTGTFVPLTAANADAALALIIVERRKELFGRNLHWADLRRLNQETKFATTLSRTINGNSYSLAPDSKRYAYPIPLDEVKLSGLEQNERP